jgi:hypothetical protein
MTDDDQLKMEALKVAAQRAHLLDLDWLKLIDTNTALTREATFAVGTQNGQLANRQLANRTVHALGRDVPELDDTSARRDLGWRVDRVVERTVRPPSLPWRARRTRPCWLTPPLPISHGGADELYAATGPDKLPPSKNVLQRKQRSYASRLEAPRLALNATSWFAKPAEPSRSRKLVSMTRLSFRLWRSQNYASGKAASVGGLFSINRPAWALTRHMRSAFNSATALPRPLVPAGSILQQGATSTPEERHPSSPPSAGTPPPRHGSLPQASESVLRQSRSSHQWPAQSARWC